MATETVSSARVPATQGQGRPHSTRGCRRSRPAILWLVVLLWTIPTAGLLINSFREPAEQRTSGWWTVFQDPTFTLDAYDRALTNASGGSLSMWDYFLNSHVDHDPGDADPDRHRRARGLRVRVDAVPGSRLAVHPAAWPCWRSRCRPRSCRC